MKPRTFHAVFHGGPFDRLNYWFPGKSPREEIKFDEWGRNGSSRMQLLGTTRYRLEKTDESEASHYALT